MHIHKHNLGPYIYACTCTHTCAHTNTMLTNFTINLLYYFRIASDILWGHIHDPILIPS